jgi:hypothetical protein
VRIPLGRHRLNIEVTLTSVRSKSWEELQSVELDDTSLAQFNRRSGTRDADAHWRGMKWLLSGWRHV